MTASPDLIRDFHRDGYVMMKDAVTADQVARLTAVLDR